MFWGSSWPDLIKPNLVWMFLGPKPFEFVHMKCLGPHGAVERGIVLPISSPIAKYSLGGVDYSLLMPIPQRHWYGHGSLSDLLGVP